jgi:hypothetical protein
MSQLRLLALWFSKLMNLESIEGLDEALPRGRGVVPSEFRFKNVPSGYD